MNELDIMAVRENLPQVLEFVEDNIRNTECSDKIRTQLYIAVEEIFVNISSYAYDPEVGRTFIRVEIIDEPLTVKLCFIDNGQPYDPLAKPDPNLNIPLRERKKGGLGIFMVKKTMDDVSYEYKDGQNILTIRKNIE